MYYIGSMFRYERPQAGRLREFHQVGVECFGSNNPATDVETIAMGHHLFEDLGRLVLLALIPFLNKKGITFVSGSLYSLAIGPVWITDPLIGVQTVLTATRLDLALLLSMVIPVVQIGRASCRERV